VSTLASLQDARLKEHFKSSGVRCARPPATRFNAFGISTAADAYRTKCKSFSTDGERSATTLLAGVLVAFEVAFGDEAKTFAGQRLHRKLDVLHHDRHGRPSQGMSDQRISLLDI
jgi:hypothetical protein